MAHLRAYGQLLLHAAQTTLRTRRWLDDARFVDVAFRGLLCREADEYGRADYLNALQRKQMRWRDVLRSMMASSEYQLLRGKGISALHALHQARVMLVRHLLPPAEIIVDLGGATSIGQPEGALLAMGYPHRPRAITIIDLPPAARLDGRRGAEDRPSHVTPDGTEVRYLYRSMTDLSPISDASVDMVFSGESIEHVSEAGADAVCREAHRVLKAGGYFCLDTPNALLTRLESPDEFIHPEHQKEYRPDELRVKLERWGFEVVEAKALCPMPESRRTGQFSYEELARNIRVADNPDDGYLFYLKGRKR